MFSVIGSWRQLAGSVSFRVQHHILKLEVGLHVNVKYCHKHTHTQGSGKGIMVLKSWRGHVAYRGALAIFTAARLGSMGV